MFKRSLTLIVGWTGNWLMVKGFDFVLYPYVMYTCGTVRGWIVMVFASLLVCLLTLAFYDWSKRDWIGIEAVKSLRDNEARGRTRGVIAWALKKGDWPALIALSIYFDPLITALYLRRGSNKFDGFTRRDWLNFSASLIISNLYWGLIVLAGIDIVQWVWVRL